MFNRYHNSLRILLAVIGICFFTSIPAYASNGMRMLGFSARDSAMAGSTIASPEDTSCLIENPAGLVRVGNRIDAEYTSIFLHDVTIHTEGSAPGSPLPSPYTLSNLGERQTSNLNYIPAGNAGVSYRLPGMSQYPVSVGCGFFTTGGMGLNYSASRLNPVLSGDYDKMIELLSARIAPGIAVAVNDKLSFGVTGNIQIQAFKTNMATTNFNTGIFKFPETSGGGDWDVAPGGGFTIGTLYKFHEMLDVGATYESHTWMGHHYKYNDCMPYIDEPPVVSAGFAFKPVKDFVFTYATKYIEWTDVKALRRAPADGGLGWKDQWVFAFGSEYNYKDKLKLRLGYNYGKSQIRPDVVFANALIPLVMEHHITTGFSYFIKKNLSFDFVWEHHFMGVQTDNGSGDVYSKNGVGTKITGAAEIVSAGMGYQF